MTKRIKAEYRSWIRKQVNITYPYPIEVLKNYVVPKLIGDNGYWTTPSGKTKIIYPNAYRWPKVYHPSTKRIIVGRKFLDKKCIPIECFSIGDIKPNQKCRLELI